MPNIIIIIDVVVIIIIIIWLVMLHWHGAIGFCGIKSKKGCRNFGNSLKHIHDVFQKGFDHPIQTHEIPNAA